MTKRFETYSGMVIQHPIKLVIVSIVLAMGFAFGAKNMQFATNYRVFFAEGNPQMAAFDQIEKVYTKTDNVLFTVQPKSGDIFQRDVLSLVMELTEEGWAIPYSQRVDSISNFQHTYSEADDLTVIDLIPDDPTTLSDEEIQNIRTVALNEPLIAGKILSKDGRTTGVNVTINLPRENVTEVPEVAAYSRELVKKMKAKYPDMEIRPSGIVFLNNAFVENSMNDMATLIPAMFGCLMVVMLVLVRSISATVATLFVIMFSAMVALGFGGWTGVSLTPISAITPTIVLTLAIADSIHIIVSMRKAMQAGMEKREAIRESLRINLQPVFLTSITTIVGFLCLNFSESPPFWHLGNMTAMGIGAAFLFSVVLLPALLSLLPLKVKVKEVKKSSGMQGLAEFVVKNYRPLLAGSIVVTVILSSMISRIEVNDQYVQYFDKTIDFRPDTEFMMNNLSGIYSFDYSIEAEGPNKVSSPEYLTALDNFTLWLRDQDEVDHVYSMSDIFKRLNRNMHSDDDSWYKIPDSDELAGQYLLLYELSLPYGLDLNDRINIEKSATRVSVTVKDLSTDEIRAFKAKTEEWLKANAPEYMHAEASGPTVMFAYITKRNVDSMLKGNIISLVIISLIIIIALRSFKIGIISLLPNLLPVAVGFGIWGLLVGQINMAAAFAFAVCLGIIVDDTVHFLSKYLRARKEQNLSSEEAVKYAFDTVGTALVVTTIILIGGFLVLAQSGFQMNSYLGLLTAIVISVALILDFFLLPPMLMWTDSILSKLKTKKQ